MTSPEEQAENAESAEDFATAFRLWSGLAQDLSDPVMFCRAGASAKKLGRWAEAESAFMHALKIDPALTEAMEYLGSLFLDREDGEERDNLAKAKVWFLRALNSARSARVLTFLGSTLAALGDVDGAASSFEQAIEIDRTYEEAYLDLAVLKRDQDPGAAMKLLEKAIDLDPDYLEAHQQLGVALQTSGDVLGAEYHFRRCLELNPSEYWSRLYLANVLAVQRRDKEAESEYRQAMALNPGEGIAFDLFANFLDELSRSQEAEEIRTLARLGARPFPGGV